MSSESEKLEIHLRDGSVLFTTVQEDDEGVDSLDRLDDFIEKVVFGAARWVWIGDAYVHNRSISAIQYASEVPEVNYPELSLVEDVAP